jgi:molybdate transport system ATP-binding protein
MMLDVAVRKRRNGFDLDAAFRVDGPGVVALFGRSGSGKTTLVDMLAGLLAPDDGVICLGETTLFDRARGVDLPPERRRCGYVFQDTRLFPHLDVESNLRYGLRRAGSERRAIAYDEVVALLALEALVGRRPRQLSGGERQRVAIGRALLSQPDLLLLDEPLASLDAARRDEVLPYLERLRDALSMPIVYVSHQYDEVLRLASHVVMLEQGRVQVSGELSAVSLHPALRALVGPENFGAVLDGEVTGVEASGLSLVRLGSGTLRIPEALEPGKRVRVRLLARDLILALEEPRGISVRNALPATVVAVESDRGQADLVHLDIGGARVAARVTRAATADLGLKPGLPVRVLVKSVSISSRAFA